MTFGILAWPQFDIVVVHHSGDIWRLFNSIRLHSDHLGKEYRVRLYSNNPMGLPSGGIFSPPGTESSMFMPGNNIGWDKAVNAGIALSTAPHVVLMNDDTEVQTEGWLEKLRQPMLDDPTIGMVGPVTGRPGFQEKQRDKKDVVIAAPEIRFDKYGAGTTPLSFFCVMISRPCLIDVGYMDERFAGSYGASDDDYQIRAHLKGWKIAVQPSVYVDHIGGATFGERRAAEQHVNEQKIKEKWRKRLCES